jgi:hypothetical protein
LNIIIIITLMNITKLTATFEDGSTQDIFPTPVVTQPVAPEDVEVGIVPHGRLYEEVRSSSVSSQPCRGCALSDGRVTGSRPVAGRPAPVRDQVSAKAIKPEQSNRRPVTITARKALEANSSRVATPPFPSRN